MRIAVVGFLLVACWCVTHRRLIDWTDDRALWLAAVRNDPSPRAALNLAGAYLRAGDFDRAAWIDTIVLTDPHGLDDPLVQQTLQAQLRWMSAFGSPVCARPPWAAHC